MLHRATTRSLSRRQVSRPPFATVSSSASTITSSRRADARSAQASDTVQVTGRTRVRAGGILVAGLRDQREDRGSTCRWKGHSSLFLYMAAAGCRRQPLLEDTRPSDTGTNVLFTANGSPPATGEVSVDGVSNTVTSAAASISRRGFRPRSGGRNEAADGHAAGRVWTRRAACSRIS